MARDPEIPYRFNTDGIRNMVAERKPQGDTTDYDKLAQVRDLFAEEIEGLYKDFNAFDTKDGSTVEDRWVSLGTQVSIKQGVYDILQPMLDQVDNIINDKQKEYRNG